MISSETYAFEDRPRRDLGAPADPNPPVSLSPHDPAAESFRLCAVADTLSKT